MTTPDDPAAFDRPAGCARRPRRRSLPMPWSRWSVVPGHAAIMWMTVLMAVMVAPGCSRGPVRPAPRDWSDTWVAAQELIPPQSRVGVPDDATCEDVLVSLREIRSELTPAPDEVLEDAVRDWLAQAEHMFFECFDAGSDQRTAYERLNRLRQQVDAALEVAGTSPAGTTPRRRGVRIPGFVSGRGSIARGSR